MGQNRDPRNKPMYCQLITTNEPRIYNEKRIFFLINGVGKTG